MTVQSKPMNPPVRVSELLCVWLRQNNLAVTAIDFDANLTAEGILDSFQFVNFLLYIEHVRGSEIDRSLIDAKSFSTVNSILKNFFGGEPAPAA